MKIGIVDVGYRNFALSIEHVPNLAIKELTKQYESLDHKIIERKPHTPQLKKILNEFHKSCKNILLEVTDMNEGKVGLQNSTRRNLAKYLESKKSLLKQCSYIAVEQQFKTGQSMNFDAVLFGESCYSWLVVNLPHVNVSYTPSRYKTCLLGCPREVIITQKNGLRKVKPIEKRDRKKWAVEMAKEIFTLRNDTKSLEYLDSNKADDVSDCLLMTIAFILKLFVM
jgi:hypothetical protein